MSDDIVNLEELKKELIRDEGIRRSAYKDSLGYWTIGIGRLIDGRKGGKLSDDEIDLLLHNDIEVCVSDLEPEQWYLTCETNEQKRALLNMRFQLGGLHLRQFGMFLSLMSQKKFKEAADDLRHTLWYRQVPERAERICRMIYSE